MGGNGKKLPQTASQTVGPFFGPGLIREPRTVLAGPEAEGERIVLHGRVLDGDGQPVPDALVEIWQADGAGVFHEHVGHPEVRNFCSWGRSPTGADGWWSFRTVKPGSAAAAGGSPAAPHVNVHVFARGLLIHASTRAYFEGDPANSSDPVLRSLDEHERRTLIATQEQPSDGSTAYRFDIHLQGEEETVFFEP